MLYVTFVGDLVSVIHECVPNLNVCYIHVCVLCSEKKYIQAHVSCLLSRIFRFQSVLDLTKQKILDFYLFIYF